MKLCVCGRINHSGRIGSMRKKRVRFLRAFPVVGWW